MPNDQPQQVSQINEVTAQPNGAGIAGKVINETPREANLKADNGEQNSAYVKSGMLPGVELHDHAKHLMGNKMADVEGGAGGRAFSDHARNGDGRPGHEGHHMHGRGHMIDKKLTHEEVHKLPADEKAKFKAEIPEARQYHAEESAWRKSGKTGPEPTRPDMPEHAKVASEVKADKQAWEAQHKKQGA